MGLEDFEKQLAAEKAEERRSGKHHSSKHHRGEKSRRKDHHGHDHGRRHQRPTTGDQEIDAHKSKRRRRDSADQEDRGQLKQESHGKTVKSERRNEEVKDVSNLQRDSWMQGPSALDVEYIQKPSPRQDEKAQPQRLVSNQDLKIHDNDLNKAYLQDIADGKVRAVPPVSAENDVGAEQAIPYTFGDAGSSWRMTKLKGLLRRAADEAESKDLDTLAIEQYGNLQAFDAAREEQRELERRAMYGESYEIQEKPCGDLFRERQLDGGNQTALNGARTLEDPTASLDLMPQQPILDPSALNKLKANLIKARLRRDPKLDEFEREYEIAVSAAQNGQKPQEIALTGMNSRILSGKRGREVTSVDNKRGRERGLVRENEDMTIDDMVREERQTRHQAGGEAQRYAERVAKDGRFANDLDYMDDNASRLAQRVHKSDVNLKNTAIADFQRVNRILDNCPLCHHEELEKPPVAPVVSLATRVYLTLPTEPELCPSGACIVPIQHRKNLLECDDDEWEEIRNFMKALTRFYHEISRHVIFYENAAAPDRHLHAAMQAVPLPLENGSMAPAFFREAILASEEEWTQHKKIIDTAAQAKSGLGRAAFRKSLVAEMPYFHVWFDLDGGLGHVVEDSQRWPRGDLFAREIIGGMLDVAPDVIRRQGRWTRGTDPRVESFRRRWKPFDWTRILTQQ